MCGVANTWTQTDAGISGHPIPVFTLSAHPSVSLAFMRLPDGNIDGSGFASTNHTSLQDLWTGTITTMQAIDGSSSYTKATLTSTLTGLMSSFQPDQVNMQDYVGTFGDGDHSDHHAAAYLVQAALQAYATPHSFTGYEDYGTTTLAANVTGADLTTKQNTFFTYAQDDVNVCGSNSSCAGSNYALWLQRQYTVGSGTGGGSQAPVANAGANQSVQAGATVTLDGSGSSDPGGNTLTYLWTQTAGPTVTLSSTTVVQPTFTAPASAATLTFQLVVNNGQSSSTPATVTITVNSNTTDLALTATATASSQNTSTEQTADKAIDGVIDGYPGDYTKEWATIGGGAGSWLKLTWTSPQTANQIILYDRPNTNDQITGGNIQFSDGSSITISALNNNGSATTFTFAAKTFTSLQLNITSVSASTENVGLSEIQVYNTSGGGSQAPVANAGSSQSVQVGATVTLDGSGSSDPGGNTLTYLWSQTAGPTVTLSSTTAVKPTFTAPASATTLTFQLVVNNGQTSSSPATVTITVTAASQPPVANAGSNQSVQTGATVTLDGSGSTGSTLTYLWTQTAGPTVTLSSTTAVKPTFTAPASATTLTFQLVVNNGQTSSSPATVTITVNSSSTDLALSATATASSQNTSTGQTANKAIDGVIDGYPGDYTKEWATIGGGAGSWLKLTWTSAQTVGRIVLYDRPNLNDQITGGNIQFSDGSSITIGALNNNGSATTFTFAAKTFTSLQLNITSVSASTQNIGLSEIQVYAS